ncbi:hypothetical protein BDV06DRAFT_230747 [Aspergillus oleicola]
MTLMPVVWVLYMFNYLDRNNIAYVVLSVWQQALISTSLSRSSMLGMLETSSLTLQVSADGSSYMLAQLPSNMIITRVQPSIYLPCCVMVWSCVSAATAGVTSFSGLVAVRFFLGIVEAPFFPGAFYVLSSWYTRKELALRTAVLYSGLILATAFSGLIAAGIFTGLDGARGLTGWQWLFIIEGAGSFFAAMVAMTLLPDYINSKSGSGQWLLTPQERGIAASRIAADRVSVPDADRSVWYGVSLAIKDFRTWIFFLMLCSNHTAYGFNNFFPSIVRGFNLGSNTITLVLTAPPYLFAAAVSFVVAYSSDRYNERGYHISLPMCFAITGFIISTATLSVPARYVASFLYASGAFAAIAMVYSWAASVLNQTPEKRAAGTAIINLLSQCGNIWSPYFFRHIVCAMGMKVVLKKENRKLLRLGDERRRRVTLYTV